jgi:hypothetical protein
VLQSVVVVRELQSVKVPLQVSLVESRVHPGQYEVPQYSDSQSAHVSKPG